MPRPLTRECAKFKSDGVQYDVILTDAWLITFNGEPCKVRYRNKSGRTVTLKHWPTNEVAAKQTAARWNVRSGTKKFGVMKVE